jgi:hypothetical protein
MTSIRELFSDQRRLDRPIEKVIDYTVDDPRRLEREIDEYHITERLEDSFRRILEIYESGVRLGDVTEVGIWVSGFYGSGKSSFTKYLGFALDPDRLAGDIPFLERLVARFRTSETKQLYRATSARFPATVVMLDLARDQLIESTAAPITNVLYAKVLQRVGYSKVPKLADLEVRLAESGQLDRFRQAYLDRFPGKGSWDEVHDDPLIGPARAAQLVPAFLEDFPTPDSFRQQHYQERLQVSELAARMIRLLRQKTGRENIIFVVDEVGQYVAPRTDLMLNLDGLVRSFKEIGQGKVWLIATAQQTLSEIVERAILNSAELVRLKDRFPISIELNASDIREITYQRLLTKRDPAIQLLRDRFRLEGEVLTLQTRVEGFGTMTSSDLDPDVFSHMYPFLPLHFDLVLSLIRRLARRTGGTGLRSAIRVVQDLLVDATRALPAGHSPIADRSVNTLACADDIYDTLCADIGKELPHVVEGVGRVQMHPVFSKIPTAIRVAKAIGALQPLDDDFPRTAENLAAVLYPALGARPVVDEVRDILQQFLETRELGIVEVRSENESDHTLAGGYSFLSDKVRPLQQERDDHRPTGADKRLLQNEILRAIFDPQPETQLNNVRSVRSGLALGTTMISGEGAEVRFLLEPVAAPARERRLEELKNETKIRADWQSTIVWLTTPPHDLDDLLAETCRSAYVTHNKRETDADGDVVRYVRGERRRLERLRDAVKARLTSSLHDGWFVFQALARPVREFDSETLMNACNVMLTRAAADVFPAFRYAAIAARTNQAARFLEWERLDRIPRDVDPLNLVETRAGQPRVKTSEPPLKEVLRVFTDKVEAAGTGRLQGSFVQDLFAAPPYGWVKDTTRYLFAALLTAGAIEIHTPAGALRTPGPNAVEAFRNTASFNRIGLSPRGSRPSIDVLDRSARIMEGLFGVEVLPLEDHISRSVRAELPRLLDRIGSLPDRLRLLGLPGEQRARALLQQCSDLLQEDAGGAASILGTPQSELPADVRWARETADSLNGDGEETIRFATVLRHDLLNLGEVFPEQSDFLLEEPLRVLEEVLESETFASRMAVLRDAVLQLSHAIESAYKTRRQELGNLSRKAREELEKTPEWPLLDTEDRDVISARLSDRDIPEEPASSRRLSELRRLLTKIARLPIILEQCKTEVHSRLPPQPDEGSDEVVIEGHEQLVSLKTLLDGDLFDSAEAVEHWLQDVRRRLLALLELGPVRIVPGEDT